MSVIKTLKQKNKNGTEESLYPKTTTKAVVDSDTNKTLDVILDEMNDKVDNIEISGETPIENLLVYPYAISNKTEDNYSIVDNKDGTLTINCSMPSDTAEIIPLVFNQPLSPGTYTLSGCPEGFADNNVDIGVKVYDTLDNRIYYSTINDKQNFTFTITELSYLSLSLTLYLNASLTNAVLKPMLEKGTIAHDYVPYKDVSVLSKTGGVVDGKLTVKDNVVVEGDLFVPIAPEQSFLNSEITNFTAPTAGGWQEDVSYLFQDMANSKTFLGSYQGAVDAEGHENYWHNVISVRHRNGRSDGNGFGMYLRSALTTPGSLCWNKQYGASGTWESEKIILDTENYANYALPLSGGTVTGVANFNQAINLPNGHLVAIFASGGGDNGYVKFAIFTCYSHATYAGALMSFRMTTRGATGIVHLNISNSAAAGQGFIGYISQTGNIPQCYMIQSSTGVFELYAAKSAWDWISITDFVFPQYQQHRMTVTWTDTFVSSLPSGVTVATVTNDWSGIVESASTSMSLSLRKGFNYIVFATCSNGMSFTETIIYRPWQGDFIILNNSYSGAMTSAISGSTYTGTFSGSPGENSRLYYTEIGVG